mmetsp:Transcript_67353/g.132853  ORF Transcript_67353/g.132853 Transcript_67353/m.132853 type:complete len:474 (+) Transcript_67353:49-1470(+)
MTACQLVPEDGTLQLRSKGRLHTVAARWRRAAWFSGVAAAVLGCLWLTPGHTDSPPSPAASLFGWAKDTAEEMPMGRPPWKAAAVGSGAWGNTVAMLVAENVAENKNWVSDVKMQIFDELILSHADMYGLQEAAMSSNATALARYALRASVEGGLGRELSTIINEEHENVKYLPGVKLPTNLKAEPDMQAAIADADLIVVGVPDQFIVPTCRKMKPFVKPTARLVMLAKGIEFEKARLVPVTSVVATELNLPENQICCLMGANIAKDVAFHQFSESTLGCKDAMDLQWLKPIFARPYFPVALVQNVEGPQMCGALKNVVAIGKGLLDGSGAGSNTMSALMRMGMQEIKGFILEFFDVPQYVFWESCCLADLVTTCLNGRNQRVAAEYARRHGRSSFEALERELLDGQRLQGTVTALPLHEVLVKKGWLEKYPLFEGVYQVVAGKADAQSIFTVLQKIPQTDVAVGNASVGRKS